MHFVQVEFRKFQMIFKSYEFYIFFPSIMFKFRKLAPFKKK